jgi:general secretion pathway protein G
MEWIPTYALYSNGAYGRSDPPLTSQLSHDDILRANNGRFLGLSSDY